MNPLLPPRFAQLRRPAPHRHVIFVAGVLLLLAGAGRAQTLTDQGATAPVPGAYDISQLSTTGNTTNPDGLNYYTDDDQSGHTAGEPGQTFTTGAIPAGATVTNLTIKTAGLSSDKGIGTAQDYYLHFYTVSGGTATLIATYTSGAVAFNDGDWLAWTGLSVPLAQNTTYAYSFGRTSSGTGWEAMAVAGGSPYAGGEIGLFPMAGGTITLGAGYDAVFDLGIIVPSRPVAAAPVLSPTNNPVYAGTPVTLTGTATGQTPLYYQWRTDGGGGGALTNLPGAVATNLNVNSTGWAAGAYRYAVVVSNSVGVSTSSVAVLNLVAGSAPIRISDLTPNPALGYVGGSLTFSAAFTGTLPISYQWQVNTASGTRNLPGRHEHHTDPGQPSDHQFGRLHVAGHQCPGRSRGHQHLATHRGSHVHLCRRGAAGQSRRRTGGWMKPPARPAGR